jgi:Tfp pilus assembly protein PilX
MLKKINDRGFIPMLIMMSLIVIAVIAYAFVKVIAKHK